MTSSSHEKRLPASASQASRPASEMGDLIPDDILDFALLLGYNLRKEEGLKALREDVEFVRQWRTRTRNFSKLLLWAGGALFGGMLAGLGGALLASGHSLLPLH